MPRSSTYSQGNGQEIPLGSFAPDADPTTPGILLDVQGAMPTTKGLRPLPSPTQFGSALPLAPNGATVAFYSDGSSSLIAGTVNHLYRYIGGVPTECVSGHTFAAISRWRFFQFGDDVIACAQGTAPYVARGVNGTFAALGGSPPVNAITGCTTLGTAFLFAGANWFSSASGVDNNWVPNVQTLAATGTLYDVPGSVVAAVPFYGNVIAFKQTAMWLGSFVGPPNSWSWQLISDNTGTWNQESVIVLADKVAFVGSDDFYTTSGSVPQRIPNNVAEWFFNNVDRSVIANTYGWYDESNATFYWHAISKNAPIAGTPDIFVSYNQRAQRWCNGHLNTSCVPYPPLYGAAAGAPIYFDTSFVPQQLNGPRGPMSFLTGYMGDADRLTELCRWRPKYALGNPSGPAYPAAQNLAAYHTNVLGQVPVPSPGLAALGTDGWFNLRQTDRYHQVSLATSGDCEVASFSFEARVAGIR